MNSVCDNNVTCIWRGDGWMTGLSLAQLNIMREALTIDQYCNKMLIHFYNIIWYILFLAHHFPHFLFRCITLQLPKNWWRLTEMWQRGGGDGIIVLKRTPQSALQMKWRRQWWSIPKQLIPGTLLGMTHSVNSIGIIAGRRSAIRFPLPSQQCPWRK